MTLIRDTEQIRNAAAAIISKAGEYEVLYNAVFAEFQQLGNDYSGEDYTKFITVTDGFKDDFAKMKKLMEEYAQFLKSAAQAMDETKKLAEQRAAALQH